MARLLSMASAVLLLSAFAFACSSPTGTIAGVAVAPASANLTIGHTQQFTATGACSDGSQQDLCAAGEERVRASVWLLVDRRGRGARRSRGRERGLAHACPISITGASRVQERENALLKVGLSDLE